VADPDHADLVDHRRSLDLRDGTLIRSSVYEDGKAGG
jgi:trehalose/maltose hydrolase-like predicted phosphorylase